MNGLLMLQEKSEQDGNLKVVRFVRFFRFIIYSEGEKALKFNGQNHEY